MRRQHGPNHKLSKSQKASVFGNTFMFCHGIELWSDSLVSTGPSGLRKACGHERAHKKRKRLHFKFVPSYLVISYTLAFSGFFSVRRLSYEKPAWNICVRIFLRGCWGDAFVLYSLHLNKLFNTNVFNIICCYCWAPVSPQGQQAPKWQHHPFMYSMVSRKGNPSKEVGKERDSNLANSHQKVLWKVNTAKAVLVLLHEFSFPWDKMCLAWFLRAAIRRGHRQMYVDRHNSLCIYNSP